MPCTSPLTAYRSTEQSSSGGYGITFNAVKALNPHNPMKVPCGQCIGCRLDKAQAWAIRCTHEAQMHKDNCFITLTYDQQSVPADYSVKLRDWQLFMKRLRKHYGQGVRFLAVGEYGGRGLRPHYHALLFGMRFGDERLLKVGKHGPIFRSPTLERLWPSGTHEIDAVNARTAGYCARYSMKKVNGDRADAHYTRVSPIDGNTYRVSTEFMVMSRRPGLGTSWLQKHKAVSFGTYTRQDGSTRLAVAADYIIIDGQRRKVPRFYTDKLNEEETKKLKQARKRASLPHKSNNTPERLKVREKIQSIRAKRLLRTMES